MRSHLAPYAVVACATTATAHIRPLDSGAGFHAVPGSTLPAGTWRISLRADGTNFRDSTPAEAVEIASGQGRYDYVQYEHVESAGISLGVTDTIQIDARTGWYTGSGFVQATDGPDGVAAGVADPSGLTDTWITSRWRVVDDPAMKSQAALIAGVRLPTGDDEERLDDGTLLDPDDQPGGGGVGFVFGVGWTQSPAHQLTVDASALWTENRSHDGFEEGDRFDVAIACAWRVQEDASAWPTWTLVAEILGEWTDHDERDGVSDGISGGSSLYGAPGVRCRFSEHGALGVSMPIPISQELEGHQAEERLRATVTLDLYF